MIATACAGQNSVAPVATLDQPPSTKITHHTVATGETLYSIAWRYNLEVSVLAKANGISPPYTIFPGQRLNLDTRKVIASAPTNAPNKTLPPQRSKSQPISEQISSTGSPKTGQLRWVWPVNGTLISRFGGAQALNKGIDIAAEKGEPVRTAETGSVVYAGEGLRGYGKLLIIKHDDHFLSAYAHNSKLLVKEGDPVKAGEKIAEIGSSGTNRNKLHFEIRLDGIPVDPMLYLPSR